MLQHVKHLFISLGLHSSARRLQRIVSGQKRHEYNSHKAMLGTFILPGDLVFDVGANIGLRSEIMRDLGAKVIAFEPQPDCAREIRAYGGITVVEVAVGDKEGHATLHKKVANVQASLLPGWQGDDVGSMHVQVTTLDRLIERYGTPAFCKIDVEGYELQVIQGLSKPIKAMCFEYHCSDEGVVKVKRALQLLSRLGNYEANLIGEENCEWLSEWSHVDQFSNHFPSIAHPNFWGNIFVRLLKG